MEGTRTRFWLEIFGLVSALSCALALLLATLGTAAWSAEEPASAAQTSSAQQTYEGVITDTRCGAKHNASIAQAAGDCTRVCVHGGDQFALVDGEKMYVLEGEPAALKRAAGERVKIMGTLNGDRISVESVAAPLP